jgi:hypothetical protein
MMLRQDTDTIWIFRIAGGPDFGDEAMRLHRHRPVRQADARIVS